MMRENEIGLRIEKIKQIFLAARDLTQQETDLNLVVEQLEKTENEFLSIAYEGASFTMAVKDFLIENNLNKWRLFLKDADAKHGAQIHVGLGWAIAQQQIEVLQIIETVNPLMRYRVLDGYGYYDGVFRQRISILNKQIPGGLDSKLLSGYDQGIGRSLWYSNNGAIEKIKIIISRFPESRQAAIWRGVGIASVYVGGCDETKLAEIFQSAGKYSSQLNVSAALVSRARHDANSPTEDNELACRVWCSCSVSEAIKVTIKAEEEIGVYPDDAYLKWIANIEDEIMNVKTN